MTARVAEINDFIQGELERRRLDEVRAVEAAQWLDAAGLLADSAHRPGLPLRNLLRGGAIVGSDQRPNRRHGRWFIGFVGVDATYSRRAIQRFGAIVRIGDPVDHKTQKQVAGVLDLHIETGCWSSSRRYDVRPGMPVIASHIGAGQGQFLVGVFSGDTMEKLPWNPATEHVAHVAYVVAWMDAVFVADAEAIVGATGRSLKWLTLAEFNDAWGRLRVRSNG